MITAEFYTALSPECSCNSATGATSIASDTVVHARISGAVKEEAVQVLQQMGLSNAIRLLLVEIAREKALPFEVMVPNAETVAAIRPARPRRGEGKAINSVADLMRDLKADDPPDERPRARPSPRKSHPRHRTLDAELIPLLELLAKVQPLPLPPGIAP